MGFYDFEESVKLYLKAALAEQLYGPNVHAKIKSGADAMLKRVLLLDDPALAEEKLEEIEVNN